ncbi:MAG TPA: hypothetical protein VGX71_12475 [Pseudaminobacter sp.]|nr:hypothetical protein [Pseudaminobacter sp.]
MLKEIRQAKQDHLPLPFVVRRVWFNSLDDLIDSAQPGLAASVRNLMGAAAPDAVVSASYGQGDDVRNSVAALGLGGNQPFGSLLKVGSVETLWGLDVNVVGPSGDALAKLSKEWAASVKAKDAKAVAANYADRKVQNLSSIALHLRYGGRTALLTGDARGDHVLLGLEAAGLLAPGGTIHVDVLKLPHHGSENNAAPSMFERIRADHYVVCADGIKHKHPSTATLEWLVASRAPNEIYTIHLTNHIPDGETTLTKIAMGRSFVVAVGAPRVEIALTDVP